MAELFLSSSGVDLSAFLDDLFGLLRHASFECFRVRNPLLGRVFADILGDFDDLRLRAKIALRVTLNVIYPSAPAQSRIHGAELGSVHMVQYLAVASSFPHRIHTPAPATGEGQVEEDEARRKDEGRGTKEEVKPGSQRCRDELVCAIGERESRIARQASSLRDY